MNKKRLPKAIVRPTDELRQDSVRGTQVKEPSPIAEIYQPTDREAAAPVLDAADDASLALPVPATPAPRALVVRRREPADVNTVWRLAQAQAIVERHATYAAAGGLIPLPIINVGSVTAIILRMVRMLSRLYGVPFERDRARAIVVGLAGGAVPTGFAAVATSTLHYVVPASALIGLAVSSVTASACTRSIGRVFVEHFESGETLEGFPTVDRR